MKLIYFFNFMYNIFSFHHEIFKNVTWYVIKKLNCAIKMQYLFLHHLFTHMNKHKASNLLLSLVA